MASSSSIPPGKTWFDIHTTSFVDVPLDPNDGAIGTPEFLQAAESTAKLFDILGSVAFTPVKNDMNGNIKKIRERYETDRTTNATLQSLVLTEIGSKEHRATEGLLWLNRGLDFTAQALRCDLEAKNEQTPSTSFRQAYQSTLAKHHSFMLKPIFSAAMSAVPSRKDFDQILLGPGANTDALQRAKRLWLDALEKRVTVLNKFMAGVKW